jgi:hypothetical protein
MHLLQPMPLTGEFIASASVRPAASVPTYLGSWQVGTPQLVATAQPAVATQAIAGANAAARTAAMAVATAANKRHQAAKAFAKATGNTISANPISTTISTKALPATQGSSPRRSPA